MKRALLEIHRHYRGVFRRPTRLVYSSESGGLIRGEGFTPPACLCPGKLIYMTTIEGLGIVGNNCLQLLRDGFDAIFTLGSQGLLYLAGDQAWHQVIKGAA